MLRTTEYNYEDLQELWSRIMNSCEQSDAMKVLIKLHPLVLALFRHVDDLQVEVKGLREIVERK